MTTRFWSRTWSAVLHRASAGGHPERGDVPGWVLVTLMTAGLVSVLWLAAGDALQRLFLDAIEGVSPGSGT